MSRPPKAIKRQQKLTLYYTKAEFRIITKMADRHGLTKAEFARFKSLDHKLKSRLTPEDANYFRQLAGMANNLNQLAHAANAGHLFTTKFWKH
ncbi:MAG: MobC family plasmid mobilization relaxosome protein [Bacteroidetes bacterium]|nr:MobC family plasmid mobilization relaxosome protein [Bacteroidota bacterium]